MKRIVRGALIGMFWIGVWWIGAAMVGLPLLLPGPKDTLLALIRLAQTSLFWQSTGTTLLRVAAGYALAVVCGILLAVVCGKVAWIDALLSPIRTLIRATPVSSFIILVLLWMIRGRVPVFISFLMVLPIVWTGVQEALRAVDGNLLEMGKMYRLSGWKRFRYIFLPSVRPALISACVTGLGFAWKSGIAAEVIAQPAFSVGKYLNDSKVYMETADLFAWTLTVILLSMLLEKALKVIARRWKGEDR